MSKPIKALFFIFFMLYIILFGGLIATTTTKAQSVSTPSLTPMPTATATNQTSNEISVLQAQLEEMRFYDQRLLTTVYWSLGTVVTLAILFAGFSWFSNFRLYERDKESLRRELSLETDKLRSDVKTLFAEQKSTLSMAIEEKISSELQEEFSNINSRLDRLGMNLKSNEISVELLEAKLWELKAVDINAMKAYESALEKAISTNQSQYYSAILNGILSTIERLNWVTTHTMANLERLFSQLPTEQQPSCNNIREKLKEKLK